VRKEGKDRNTNPKVGEIRLFEAEAESGHRGAEDRTQDHGPFRVPRASYSGELAGNRLCTICRGTLSSE
jgi:hypothetical protein